MNLILPFAESVADPETETSELMSAKSAEDAARATLDAAQNEPAGTHHQARDLQASGGSGRRSSKVLQKETWKLSGRIFPIRNLQLTCRAPAGALDKAEGRKEETEKQLVTANPEEIDLRRQRAKATLQTVEAEQRRLRDDAIGLGSRLGRPRQERHR